MATGESMNLILESFDRNGRINRAVLDSLTVEDFKIDDGTGGWNLGQLLAEICDFRRDWLTRISPRHADSLPNIVDSDDSGWWLAVKSIGELRTAFDAGDAAARDAVVSAVEEGRGFTGAYESHPAHFLQHIIVHDSHHRGQIMTLLRQAGRSAEDRERLEEHTWPIWRE